MAYGLALSLAASMPARVRAKAIGLAMGAFALSGIVLPVALGTWIATAAPDAAFWRIGIVVLVVGALCLASLAGAAANDKTRRPRSLRPDRSPWIARHSSRLS
ncbi:hypothetical protein ABMA32_13835 [Mesorhizobium sp. VNQ89]|uniref:hypothetical protein n=1 Tax=Mesorhizobium quangtriensis TaxID=3157709 RepID=UPI0032B79A00